MLSELCLQMVMSSRVTLVAYGGYLSNLELTHRQAFGSKSE